MNTCETCKYNNESITDERCYSCDVVERQNWEPMGGVDHEKHWPCNSSDRDEWEIKNYEFSAKHDEGRPRCDLVSPALIEAVGYIRGYGTEKYGDSENWKTVESKRFMAALMRHLCPCLEKLDSIDEESGFPNMYHVACNVNFLVDRVREMMSISDKLREEVGSQ